MKRFLLLCTALMMVLGWTSCGDNDDYQAFVGTWGAQRIDYYNIDYAGAPIEASMSTFFFTPGDADNGIDLVFRDDRSGEMRDRSRDTFYIPVLVADTLHHYDTLVNPDTTVVTKYTYSYHNDDALLYMNMEVDRPFTYKMQIELLTNDCFVYVNEYKKNYIEKARLIRITDDTRSSRSTGASKPVSRPRRPGSLFSND